MSAASNLRPHPIEVPGIDGVEQAARWLAAQSEAVRAVTTIDSGGRLLQRPRIDPASYVDLTALLIGGLIVERGCYIGPHAVVRLDEKRDPEPCVLGEDSNIQDGAVVHADTTSIGRRVIVAHQAIVHGATIEDDASLYIQAVADGGSVIGSGCFLHQGSYVGRGLILTRGRYVAPGQKVLTQDDADRLPDVPEALQDLRRTVLACNLSHTRSHGSMTD